MSDGRRPSYLVSRAELAALREAVARRTGVHLRVDSLGLLEARLYSFAHARGLEDVGTLVAAVLAGASSELGQRVIEGLVNGETSFFRDPMLFDELGEWVLPELIARRRALGRLRLWSAACSTGQEPYSLALLLAEQFGDQLAGWDVRIIASDVSRYALARAALGHYDERELSRGLSHARIERWFEPDGHGGASVGRQLRRMIQFQRINLIDPWPQLPPMDLVLIRNVMLYWPIPLRVALARKLQTVVNADAFVTLGGAEVMPRLGEFRGQTHDHWIFYRLAPHP